MNSNHPLDSDDEFSLEQCEVILEYEFQDYDLLENALTHASIAKTRLASNERLEFLGDAILGAVVCEELFSRYPTHTEGELTRVKSVVVSRETCSNVTKRLGLENFIRLGKGLSGNKELPLSIVAGVFESVVAAIYLDGGYDAAREFLTRVMKDDISEAEETAHSTNFKSLLQQFSQKQHGDTPVYNLLDEKGPDHSKCFKISATIGNQEFPAAWGPNKKEAEQRAATNAFHQIEGKDVPFSSDDLNK